MAHTKHGHHIHQEEVKMKTHKFARKPFYVDAVRVTTANIHEVAEWCGGEVLTDGDDTQYIKARVYRPLDERQTKAFVNDWVLHAGSGFKIYTSKAFDKSFEKVKTLSKSQADEAGIRPPIEPKSRREAVTNVGRAVREADRLIKEVLSGD